MPILALNAAGVPPASAALVTADADVPQVEVLVAAPTAEVSAQLITELDGLDAGQSMPPPAPPGAPRIVSVDDDGQVGDDSSFGPDLGEDGDVIAFTSRATNLGDTDPDRLPDGLAHDLATGTTTELPFPGPDPAANGGFGAQAISADNRRVVFTGLSGENFGVRVLDRTNGEIIATVLASDVDPADPTDLEIPAISADGEWIAFAHADGIYRQRVDGTGRELVLAVANENAFYADLRMSGDGQRIITLFDDTHGQTPGQLFLVESGQDVRNLSLGVDGQPADMQVSDTDISAGGTTVAFTSRATNLTADTVDGVEGHLFVHDIATGTTRLMDRGPDGQPAVEGVSFQQDGYGVSLTADGSRVVFTSEDDGLSGGGEVVFANVLSLDVAGGAVTVEAVPPDGSAYDSPTISGDGTRIAFEGTADFDFMTQIYLLDRDGP